MKSAACTNRVHLDTVLALCLISIKYEVTRCTSEHDRTLKLAVDCHLYSRIGMLFCKEIEISCWSLSVVFTSTASVPKESETSVYIEVSVNI